MELGKDTTACFVLNKKQNKNIYDDATKGHLLCGCGLFTDTPATFILLIYILILLIIYTYGLAGMCVFCLHFAKTTLKCLSN